MKSVCVLGAYGIFGSRITKALIRYSISVIIAGRNKEKALALKKSIKTSDPKADIQVAIFDVKQEIKEQLHHLEPTLVINTCGPFQTSDYHIAQTCIALGIHYIDLADGREFVNNISSLDKDAKSKGVMVISGASTVPGLSSAVIEHFRNRFKHIEQLDFGITPGAKTPRGVATAKSILSYIGKPLKPFPGGRKVYGWQNTYRIQYPELGTRWMGNCEVPDLDLLPEKYQIDNIHFSAGMENKALHFSIWFMSWLVRLGFPLNLMNYASMLTKLSHLFDIFGTQDGGMHVILKGTDPNNEPLTIKWFIIVKKGEGPQVPTIPSILLTKKILAGEHKDPGAKACVGLVTLEEYMDELKEFEATDFTFEFSGSKKS